MEGTGAAGGIKGADSEALLGPMEALKRGSETFLEASRAMHEQIKEWEHKEAHWKDLTLRIQRELADAPNIVTLDVGGTLFRAPKATLLQHDGSYFHGVLGSGQWKPDDLTTQAYFLDLDPATFVRVMRFLRTGDLTFTGLCAFECRELLHSMDYLVLPVPLKHKTYFPWAWQEHAPAIELSNGDRTAQVHRASTHPDVVKDRKWMCALGDVHVPVFHVRLDKTCEYICLGLTTRKTFEVHATPPFVGGISLALRDCGTFSSPDGATVKLSVDRFAVGDVVSARFLDGSTVSFERNGTPLPGATCSVPQTTDLIPAVFLMQGAMLTIVDG
ncbi:Aste57867_24625 [Aphanomyces stellatus]|uniref:Aste57867_24625 protein n=1 Tax=Aphanomyces stellatus TaxID=120398 RepID=A0A485LSZ9_9STRA|nr:hypothetical protein As57867_024547 [Aphanomyces stellatus]VFU01262.1 Aste57867_24625 [Aphanomyces stellatus]